MSPDALLSVIESALTDAGMPTAARESILDYVERYGDARSDEVLATVLR